MCFLHIVLQLLRVYWAAIGDPMKDDPKDYRHRIYRNGVVVGSYNGYGCCVWDEHHTFETDDEPIWLVSLVTDGKITANGLKAKGMGRNGRRDFAQFA